MEKLPLETQTLYAELLEQLAAIEAHRSIGHLSGSFVTKQVKGGRYYYFQYSVPGGTYRQIYLGKEDPVLKRVLEKFQRESPKAEAEQKSIQRLCAQLRAGGAFMTDTASARVIKALSDGGIFRLDGVLIGTHAFGVLGNVLGYHWKSTGLKTQDVDLAGDGALRLAISGLDADIPKILTSLEVGFLPVPPLNAKNPSTSFKVRGESLRVDLLTPETSPNQKRPTFIPRWNAAAQPLRFLDYLIEETNRAAVLNGGGILVNVPSPARFALHKLLTSQERGFGFQTKVQKDLLQASQLLWVLAEERPGDLEAAWRDLKKRGPSWHKKVKTGAAAAKKIAREWHPALSDILI